MTTTLDAHDILAALRRWSHDEGFTDLAVSRMDLEADRRRYQAWLDAGLHGEMDYLARNAEQRFDPESLLTGTLTVIALKMPYWQPGAENSRRQLRRTDRAYISRYALGRDYHKTVRGGLKRLCVKLAEQIGPFGYRVFADSAPVLEKAVARNASLGWVGRNSLLLDETLGSYFFLGEIYTDLALPLSTAPETPDRCGNCRACDRACPTGAILPNRTLDARRCISYLTIELKGPIPIDLRRAVGNRIFGCDDCQLVCPWNQYAGITVSADFAVRHGLDDPDLLDLFGWDEATFLNRTEGMPLRRAGYAGWLRNLAVALGNAPFDARIIAALRARRDTDDAMVREHIDWALAEQQRKAAESG